MTIATQTFSRHIIQDIHVHPASGDAVLVHAKSADDEKYYFTTHSVIEKLKQKHDPDTLVQTLMKASGDEVLPTGLGTKYGPHAINLHLLTDHGKKLYDKGGFHALYDGPDKPEKFYEGKKLLNVIQAGQAKDDHMIAVAWSSHCVYDVNDLTRPLSTSMREEIWGSYYNVDKSLEVLQNHPWITKAEITSNPVWQNHEISGSRLLKVEVHVPQDVYEQMAKVCLKINGYISPNAMMDWLTKPDSYGETYAKHAPSIGPDPLGIMPFHQVQSHESSSDTGDYDEWSDY